MFLCFGVNFKFLENNIINFLGLVKVKYFFKECFYFLGLFFLLGLYCFFEVIIGLFLKQLESIECMDYMYCKFVISLN